MAAVPENAVMRGASPRLPRAFPSPRRSASARFPGASTKRLSRAASPICATWATA